MGLNISRTVVIFVTGAKGGGAQWTLSCRMKINKVNKNLLSTDIIWPFKLFNWNNCLQRHCFHTLAPRRVNENWKSFTSPHCWLRRFHFMADHGEMTKYRRGDWDLLKWWRTAQLFYWIARLVLIIDHEIRNFKSAVDFYFPSVQPKRHSQMKSPPIKGFKSHWGGCNRDKIID